MPAHWPKETDQTLLIVRLKVQKIWFDWTAFFDELFTISTGFKGVLKMRLCVSAIYEGDAIDPALMRELPEEDITKMSYQPYINGSKQNILWAIAWGELCLWLFISCDSRLGSKLPILGG